MNALLYRLYKLALQISVAEIFLSQVLECLKSMYWLKAHHVKKEGENYHTSETGMSSRSIFSASVRTNPQDAGVMYEKTTNSNTSKVCIFHIYSFVKC